MAPSSALTSQTAYPMRVLPEVMLMRGIRSVPVLQAGGNENGYGLRYRVKGYICDLWYWNDPQQSMSVIRNRSHHR